MRLPGGRCRGLRPINSQKCAVSRHTRYFPFEALWRYNAEDDITLMQLRNLFSRHVICEATLEGE